MTKKYRIPRYTPSKHNMDTKAPLVIQEGAKYPKEFIELRDENIPHATNKKFKTFYKEKRVYKPKPVYDSFEQFPKELRQVFELAIQIHGDGNVDWITLKRFLNDKSHPKLRWLWGFSLRHRGTEKIKINQNDLIVLNEWYVRTGSAAKIPLDKFYDQDKDYINRLEGILKTSKVYGNGKSVEWIKNLYLLEIEKGKQNE